MPSLTLDRGKLPPRNKKKIKKKKDTRAEEIAKCKKFAMSLDWMSNAESEKRWLDENYFNCYCLYAIIADNRFDFPTIYLDELVETWEALEGDELHNQWVEIYRILSGKFTVEERKKMCLPLNTIFSYVF